MKSIQNLSLWLNHDKPCEQALQSNLTIIPLQGYQRDGLRRQLEGLCAINGQFGQMSTSEILKRVDANSTERIREMLKTMEALKTEVEMVADLICQAAIQGKPNQLYG